MHHKTTLLMGGRTIAAFLESGETRQVKVRQLRIREYPHAMGLVENEMALLGYVCDLPAQQLNELVPSAYEELHKVMREVNAGGFFIFAARQLERANESLRMLPPEVLEKVFAKLPSLTRSPVVPPPAG